MFHLQPVCRGLARIIFVILDWGCWSLKKLSIDVYRLTSYYNIQSTSSIQLSNVLSISQCILPNCSSTGLSRTPYRRSVGPFYRVSAYSYSLRTHTGLHIWQASSPYAPPLPKPQWMYTSCVPRDWLVAEPRKKPTYWPITATGYSLSSPLRLLGTNRLRARQRRGTVVQLWADECYRCALRAFVISTVVRTVLN